MTNDLKNLLPPEQRKVSYHRKSSRGKKISPTLPLALCAVCVFALLLLLINPLQDNGPVTVEGGSAAGSIQFEVPIGPNPASASQDELSLEELGTFSLRDKVRSGDTFETILLRNGIERANLFPLLEAARDSHNLNRVVTGRTFEFAFQDSLLQRVVYEIDDDRKLIVSRADSASWLADVEETEYIESVRELAGTIESSLYENVMEVYGNPELALKLSEIYAWQIDFHNDVRKGDTWKMVFREKVHPEKDTRKVGDILAAVYINQDREIYAFRFTNPDSSVDYFEPDGKSVRRKFLRSPFKYTPRISSGFSYRRFHPILRRYRPHLGIDYAAPTGTPVLALGSGKVVQRGWNGGYGHYVKIKHNGMYTTGYGHLSGYAKGLKAGSYVEQGQVIGYVGSTGLSTGPHLDFRFYKNGKPINPLTVDIPPGEPVDPAVFAEFETFRDSMTARLDRIGRPLFGPPLAVTIEIPDQLRLAPREVADSDG